MKSHHTRISDCQEETTSEQSLCVWKFNTDLILTFNSYILAAFYHFKLFAYMGAYRQTNIGRYTHVFTKTISVNQTHAHS